MAAIAPLAKSNGSAQKGCNIYTVQSTVGRKRRGEFNNPAYHTGWPLISAAIKSVAEFPCFIQRLIRRESKVRVEGDPQRGASCFIASHLQRERERQAKMEKHPLTVEDHSRVSDFWICK